MSRQHHWETVYGTRTEEKLSWHQDTPAISLEMMRETGITSASSVIDIGGGTSRIVDSLLAMGLRDISVLDLSQNALTAAQRRLGDSAATVNWIAADITSWRAGRQFDLWHDRAVFHFLTDPADRAAYIATLTDSLAAGSHAIIASFALDGPEKCSGLPVQRYSPQTLVETLGPRFTLLAHRAHLHHTPWGAVQSFQFSLFRRLA
jgi:2-polyprenyl-3-methyl-5-hydroxy-6-metoxy-1,4-benzoquinol methylase